MIPLNLNLIIMSLTAAINQFAVHIHASAEIDRESMELQCVVKFKNEEFAVIWLHPVLLNPKDRAPRLNYFDEDVIPEEAMGESRQIFYAFEKAVRDRGLWTKFTTAYDPDYAPFTPPVDFNPLQWQEELS